MVSRRTGGIIQGRRVSFAVSGSDSFLASCSLLLWPGRWPQRRHGGSQAGTQACRAEFATACPICGESADGPGPWANGHTADDRASFDAYLEELARHCGVCNGRR